MFRSKDLTFRRFPRIKRHSRYVKIEHDILRLKYFRIFRLLQTAAFFFVNIYFYFRLLQKGLTALHIASSHGCRGIVEMLLAADCDIDRQSKVNITHKTGRIKTNKKIFS